MRQYELTFIVHPDLDEPGRSALLAKVQGWITQEGGSVRQVNDWGRRRLAYPILKLREGHYYLLNIDMEPGRVSELERNIKLSEDIIRHLVVRVEEAATAGKEPEENPQPREEESVE